MSIDPVADPQYTLFSEESVPSVDAKPGRRKDQELTAARRPKHASMLGRFCDTGVYDMGGRGRLRSPLQALQGPNIRSSEVVDAGPEKWTSSSQPLDD